MTKKEYLSLALVQSIDWLESNALNPSAKQKPIHIALIKIAIRRKKGRTV
jgi:hypothetical protein